MQEGKLSSFYPVHLFKTIILCGRQVKSNRLVLCACSPVLRNIILNVPNNHPYIYLKVQYTSYIYLNLQYTSYTYLKVQYTLHILQYKVQYTSYIYKVQYTSYVYLKVQYTSYIHLKGQYTSYIYL